MKRRACVNTTIGTTKYHPLMMPLLVLIGLALTPSWAPGAAILGAGPAWASGGGGSSETKIAGPPRMTLKAFIVNLADPTGKRYLKVTLTLELEKAEHQAEVEYQMPPIRDAINILLSSLAFEDVASLEGKARLKTQILSRVNTFLTKGKIKNVYFDEFVVQ